MSRANIGDFQVAVPTLKSLFIEICFGDLCLATGTAILVANDNESHCTLITNRHNVTGRHQETNKCLSPKAGVPDNIVIYFHRKDAVVGGWKPIKLPLYREDESPWWIEHPRLGARADVVALNLRWGSDITKYPYYLGNQLDRRGIEVGPAETVSVIGFPFGLSSVQRFPIWATGFLAQELELVTPENPTFLIDCRTRKGQSGSAVIAYRAAGYRGIKEGLPVTHLTNETVWEFLGVYSGRISEESDLGRVWHVSAVEELLAAAQAAYRVSDDKG
ncbi:serine protease [Agrobacterium tumefaciens]|uniref:serine protease n=1 Tax=Agrobacterium tumefaciens TaxID=358 RepID=UPI0012B80375|nr:serine protease [Agrobacterium tumefaciens]MQB05720.1 serine protease [Agrobacterium tumefaciens]